MAEQKSRRGAEEILISQAKIYGKEFFVSRRAGCAVI